jgi:hypothetical protein
MLSAAPPFDSSPIRRLSLNLRHSSITLKHAVLTASALVPTSRRAVRALVTKILGRVGGGREFVDRSQ